MASGAAPPKGAGNVKKEETSEAENVRVKAEADLNSIPENAGTECVVLDDTDEEEIPPPAETEDDTAEAQEKPEETPEHLEAQEKNDRAIADTLQTDENERVKRVRTAKEPEYYHNPKAKICWAYKHNGCCFMQLMTGMVCRFDHDPKWDRKFRQDLWVPSERKHYEATGRFVAAKPNENPHAERKRDRFRIEWDSQVPGHYSKLAPKRSRSKDTMRIARADAEEFAQWQKEKRQKAEGVDSGKQRAIQKLAEEAAGKAEEELRSQQAFARLLTAMAQADEARAQADELVQTEHSIYLLAEIKAAEKKLTSTMDPFAQAEAKHKVAQFRDQLKGLGYNM